MKILLWEMTNLEILKRKHNVDKIPNYLNKIKRLLNINNPSRELLFTLIERIETDTDKNITIKFKYDIIDTYTFKYVDNRVRNPYGKKGKSITN